MSCGHVLESKGEVREVPGVVKLLRAAVEVAIEGEVEEASLLQGLPSAVKADLKPEEVQEGHQTNQLGYLNAVHAQTQLLPLA